jgi:hypothetical protein
MDSVLKDVNNSLLTNPDRGGIPANENSAMLKAVNAKAFCVYKPDRCLILSIHWPSAKR